MGDETDFEAWYETVNRRLVASLAALTHEPELAHDLAAEAMARCLARWDRRRPANSTAWTFRVALNLAKRHWRRRRREVDALARLDAAPVDSEVSEPAVELWRAVAELPARQRQAVVLRYLGDLREADVAAAMGIAPGTAAATLSKARSSLATRLGGPTSHHNEEDVDARPR